MASVLQNLLERLGLRNSEDEEYIHENFGADDATIALGVTGGFWNLLTLFCMYLIINNRGKFTSNTTLIIALLFSLCASPAILVFIFFGLFSWGGFQYSPIMKQSGAFGKNFFK